MLGRAVLMRTVCLLLVAAGVGVCQIQPAIPSHGAIVIEQFGQVSALTGLGEQPLFKGSTVKAQQLIFTGPDGYARFQVEDGSTFEVFANSQVLFHEHVGNLRELLNVVIGRVKVYIQHLNGIPNYNEVTSPTAVISVRGTVFEVVVEDEEGTTYVMVDEGTVSVKNQTAPGDSVLLQQGNSLRVVRNQPLAIRIIDKGAIAREFVKWLDQLVYVMGRSPGGPGISLPTGIPTGTGGASGDTGKTGTTPTSPGAPTIPSVPSAPGAPSAPGGPGH